jgi:hypothetical protein
MIYPLIDRWQKKASVTQLCRIFGASRSGDYAAKVKAKTPLPLCKTIMQMKAAFEANHRSLIYKKKWQ